MKIKSLQIQVQLDTYGDTPEADCVFNLFQLVRYLPTSTDAGNAEGSIGWEVRFDL
jgi:hypothetical protein